jgi:hypothetical protein
MATKVEKNTGDLLKPGEDYKDASGRDHPAESEHDHAAQSEPDHARQKLNGESAKIAKEASKGAGADEVVKPRKA